MTPLILYFIKVNIALAVLYMFYRLFFTKDTFFGLRRVVLILIYFVSFIYPLINLEGWMTKSGDNGGLVTIYSKILPEITIVSSAADKVTDYSWIWTVGTALYFTGVVIFLLRTILELVSIHHSLRRCSKEKINGVEVCLLPDAREPYSFFKWICIHPTLHSDNELNQILIHEQTHVRSYHSIDILLAQTAIVLCWFNPFAWLIRREIRINHEYLADKRVIAAGYDKKTYQYHLIGMQHQPLAAANLYNNFSVLPLKKRIKMLNKKRTRNIMKTKYLMFLPVAALLLLFSNCGNKAKTESQATTEVKDTTAMVAPTPKEEAMPTTEKEPQVAEGDKVFEIVEVMPEFPGGMSACLQYLAKNIKYSTEAQDAGQQGRVIVQFIVTKEGKIVNPKIVRSVSTILDNEAIRVVKNMPDWKPGTQKGVPVNVKFTLPVTFRLQ